LRLPSEAPRRPIIRTDGSPILAVSARWALPFSRPSPIVGITIRYNYSLDFITVSCILTVFLHLGGEEAGSPLSAQLARQVPSFRYLITSLFHYFVQHCLIFPKNPLKGNLSND
jgi:hypothetical protein